MPGRSYRQKAVITVFFTMLSVLFLSLLFMLIESVRVQGARAQSANNTDMGNVSLFGEYEQKLLTDFEVFAIDASYGTGYFSTYLLEGRLRHYLEYNAYPADGSLVTAGCFDPWQLTLTGSKVTAYTLLSDSGGESFYQQAVAYMRETSLMQASGKLIDAYRQAQEVEENQQTYEREQTKADQGMEELNRKKQEVEKERADRQETEETSEDGIAGSGLFEEEDGAEEEGKWKNPLPALARLRRKSLLKIVCGDMEISSNRVAAWQLSSKRLLKKGNLPVKKVYAGLLSNLLYREYLLDHFGCWGEEQEEENFLRYGLEYILAGKKSDEKNLLGTVKKLLLLREGLNYAYSTTDAAMSSQTESAAAALIGWTGIPELVSVMKHALLLGWAYGESLLDVRTIMMGGRVPLRKRAGEWELTLEKLADINEMLEQGRQQRSRGLNYREYLRMLLNLQSIRQQKKRGLDLAELAIRSAEGLSNFQADNCIVALRDETSWRIDPLFGRVGSVWMGVSGISEDLTVQAGYAYDY